MNNKFNFFVPATFSKSGETGKMSIKGVCSSNTEDSDGEFLDPTGFDFQPLLDKGFFNWNHQANKDANAILGRPTSAQVINNGKDLYVEGYLYKGSQHAKAVYDLANVLEQEDPDRRLGFSIEGQAIERDPINPKRVKRARITGIAITHCPKNPNTLLSIMKGEYSEPFIEEEESKEDKELDKAMGVNIDINPESVEGKPKNLIDKDKVNFLTKSEIYNKIFDTFTDDIEKAKKIYNLVEQTAEKLFNMEKGQVSDDALNKAFDILNSSTSLVKSEDGDDKEKKEEKEDEGLQKSEAELEIETLQKSQAAEEFAKSAIAEGKNRGQAIDDVMEKGGVSLVEAEGCVDRAIRETQAQKDGGAVSVHQAALTKSLSDLFTDSLEKSENSFNSSIQKLATGLDEKFGAVAAILQNQAQASANSLEKSEIFEKSLSDISQLVTKIASEPFPKKSVTSVREVEKFEKSGANDGTMAYELSNFDDRKNLGDLLLVKAQEYQVLGRPNSILEQAISDLEISKAISPNALPLLKSMNIHVVS